MLFDLRGKRKRVIQVVYAILAFLFLVSFVGFGIGSDAAGGIFDALGVGGGGHGGGAAPSSPQFEQQVERAEETLEENPNDQRALLTLARVHFLDGQTQLDQDEETGAPVVTDDAREQFQASVDGWERYLELKPKRVNDGIGLQVLQAYQLLTQDDTQPDTLQAHLEGARETAAVVAGEQPNQNTFGSLAQYAYLSGEVDQGDEAGKRALKEVDSSQRRSLKQALKQFERSGRQLQRQLEQLVPGEEELTSPLGGLGGGGPGGTPGAPPAP